MQEKWVLLDWAPCLVSNMGRVARIRGPFEPEGAHARCPVKDHDGKTRPLYVHQLVAEAFLGPRPDGCDVHHKNGDKLDNRIENLEYLTRKGHVRKTVQMGQHPCGESHGQAKLTEDDIRDIRRRYDPYKVTRDQLGEEYGVSGTTIQCIVQRRTWRHVE